MTLISDPIVRRKLSDEVFDRLKSLITSGELQPGDAMPSERDLMERLGVGRPAIREAMQQLSNMGLLTISHGERAKVRQPTAKSILRQVDTVARVLLSASPVDRSSSASSDCRRVLKSTLLASALSDSSAVSSQGLAGPQMEEIEC